MTYTKRLDSRAFDEPREMEAKVGIIPRADGSAMFRIGKTIALAAVYGPRSVWPRFLQDPTKGILRCNYTLMPFASGERIKPGPTRRSREISLVTENALLPVLDLSEFPNSTVDVFIEIPQADAGSRCAGVCAASMALADAGFTMKDLVCAIAVGCIDNNVLVDLTKEEEDYKGEVADIPIAILPRTGEFSLLQLDGEITKENLKKALELGKKICKKIYEVQKEALKKKYG